MRHSRFDQINIVPFVDIVLVLLVIVLATASFVKHSSVPIKLPESTANPTQTHDVPTIISIDSNGSYYLDDHVMTWKELRQEIDQMDTNTTHLLIRIDKATPFVYFSRLALWLKDKGKLQVSIATKTVQNTN